MAGEIQPESGGAPALSPASMRPQHNGRGNVMTQSDMRGLMRASMRPQHNGRGNIQAAHSVSAITKCFNEAPAQWPGKCFSREVLAVVGLASMRPQHNGRGNQAESIRPTADACEASMRPQHNGRGNATRIVLIIAVFGASMRPQHNGRGNRGGRSGHCNASQGFNEAPAQWPGKWVGLQIFGLYA